MHYANDMDGCWKMIEHGLRWWHWWTQKIFIIKDWNPWRTV